MNREELGYFFGITILMVGFLVGISFFNQNIDEKSFTGNVIAEQKIIIPVEKELIGAPCGANCLSKGCFSSTTSYLGYNLNVCKCLKCTDKSEKTFYCHTDKPFDKELICEWQKT
jgi:hypothetical protein